MPAHVDQKEREHIRAHLDVNMVVEAAAGTGKTTELVHRIVAVLRSGRTTVDRIVAVTFTEKAAGELKLRMREQIERERHDTPAGSDARRHLEDALARLEEARVGTIHAFCADLLRERSVEARVDPRFETLNEVESERLFREAFDVWLQEQLDQPPAGIRRSLRRRSAKPAPWRPGRSRQHARGTPTEDDPQDPVRRLRRAAWTLAEWRDFPASWERIEFDRTGRIDALVQQLHALADVTRQAARPDRDEFYKGTAELRRASAEIHTAEAVRARDYDGLEARFVQLAADREFREPRTGYGKEFAPGVARDDVKRQHAAFIEALQAFARDADADLAARLHDELQGAVERYEALKSRLGRLDFVDLLLRTRDLLRDDVNVRRDFQERFSHLFVDEFQDTDPLQAEILLRLSAEADHTGDWRRAPLVPGKLFLVADPKQSIYRFRRADVGTYLDVKQNLLDQGAELVHLTTSFRSLPGIQRAVNHAFALWMDGDREAQQAEYVPLSPVREAPDDRPTVVALPVPEPYGARNVAKRAIERSLPQAVGAFVHWLLEESGWTVSDRDRPDARVPIAARHVCILFRRFDSFWAGDVTRPYVQELEARGVRHLLVGGRSFHDREEVQTLRTALCAIEWPDDELSVFATLHGSLFAIGDEELLEYRHRFGRLHPFRLPKEALPPRLEPIAAALRQLAAFHRERNRRPIAETVHLLLEATRAHAGFVFRPSGEQVLANVLHVADQARGYESGGGISFRGFIDRLLDDADGRKAAEAPILEESSDGVRLMTVHKAKGLEFPVVILADMTARLSRDRADRYLDAARGLCAQRIAGWAPHEVHAHEAVEAKRDRAEGVRIAYVAATRARDLLVVPGIGDGPWGGGLTADAEPLTGWIAPLNAAIYPARSRWADVEPAPGCPAFGDDSVCTRPQDRLFDTPCVRPGAHVMPHPLEGPRRPRRGKDDSRYHVVWWDPHVLDLEARPVFGLQQESLISKEIESATLESDVQRYRAWERARATTLRAAAQPGFRVQTATARAAERARDGDTLDGTVELVKLPIDRERPGGARFGALVHASLGTVPLDADRAATERIVRMQSRLLGAEGDELDAALDVVEHVLQHPLLERARQAERDGACRRETPVTVFDPTAECWVEGVADLVFRDNDTWTVVDFKTDRELRGELDAYRHQVALYARAVREATGQQATSVLLRV